MKVSPRQQRVLRAVHFDVDASEASVAKRLKLKAHTVRYEIQQAKKNGLIRSSTPVHFFKLGLKQFQYYASLTSGNTDVLQKTKKFFSKTSSIAWHAHLGGRFQIGFSLCAPTERAFYEIVDTFVHTLGQGLFKRHVGLSTLFEVYPKKYLNPKEVNEEHLTFDSDVTISAIDSLDRKILRGLTSLADLPHAELARKIGVPRTTLLQRIHRMEESGLLHRKIYLMSANKLGFTTMKVLLFMAHDSAELLKKMRQFCLVHPNIVNMVRLIGAWEYEVTAEVKHPQDIQQILAEMTQYLGGWLRDVEVLQVFEQGRSENFLIESYND